MSTDYKPFDKEDLEVITETKRKFLPERIVKIDQNIIFNPNVCALNRVFTKWNIQSGLSIEYIYIYKSLYPDSYGIEIKLSKYKKVLIFNTSYMKYSTNDILYNIVSYLFAFQPKLKYDLDSALKRYFLMYKKDDDDEFHEFITNKYYETNPKVEVDKEIPFKHMEAHCLFEQFKESYADMQKNTLTNIYCILKDTNKVLDYITEEFISKYNMLLQQFDGKVYFPYKNICSKWKDLEEEKTNGYTKSKCVNMIHIKDTDIYFPVVFVYEMIENMVQPLYNLSISYAVNAYDFDHIDLELEKRFVIYVLSSIFDIDKKFTKIEEFQGKTQRELDNEKLNK